MLYWIVYFVYIHEHLFILPLSKLPDGFHNALFTNLLAAPLSILRDAMKKQIEKNNNNNSSLSLINPQTAPYKLPYL